MGGFYVNMTVRGPGQKQIAGYLKYVKRTAYISGTRNGMTLLFDEEADSQDSTAIERLAEDISKAFSTQVFAALGHDNDVFMYWLFDRGQLVDDYDSWPGFPDEERGKPTGGDAAALCAAFEVSDKIKSVQNLLASTEYTGAEERHRDLVKLLGLPGQYACDGFRSIEANCFADEDEQLILVS